MTSAFDITYLHAAAAVADITIPREREAILLDAGRAVFAVLRHIRAVDLGEAPLAPTHIVM